MVALAASPIGAEPVLNQLHHDAKSERENAGLSHLERKSGSKLPHSATLWRIPVCSVTGLATESTNHHGRKPHNNHTTMDSKIPHSSSWLATDYHRK